MPVKSDTKPSPVPSADDEPVSATALSAREVRYRVVPQRGLASFKVRYVESSVEGGQPSCPFCKERI